MWWVIFNWKLNIFILCTEALDFVKPVFIGFLAPLCQGEGETSLQHCKVGVEVQVPHLFSVDSWPRGSCSLLLPGGDESSSSPCGLHWYSLCWGGVGEGLILVSGDGSPSFLLGLGLLWDHQWGCWGTSLQPGEGGSLGSHPFSASISEVGGHVFLWCLAGLERLLSV